MAKRRNFEIAMLAALSAALPGCAGKSILPSWGSGKSTASTESSQSLESLTAKNAAATSNSSGGSIGSGLKKTGDSIASAFTIKPKVIPANDATSLNSKPGKLGPDLYVSGARVHEARGNIPAAIEQYNKALEQAPKDLGALVGLARLHDRQGQFAEAEKLYKKAGEVDPKSPLVWNDLGLCYARQKRLPEATTSIAKAIVLQPKNAMYRNNMATVLVEQGRLDEAWSQLSAVNPPDVAHYNFAYLLHQQKQNPQAVQHLEEALAANPSMAAAQQLLAKIEGGEVRPSEVVVAAPQNPARYSISDDATDENVLIAQNGPGEIVNPLAPGGRRSATYRMPPTEEQSQDPAPPPASRLPAAEEEVEQQGPELNFTIPANPKYPGRRTSHEDDSIRQPKNVIRLLGSEPIAAPIPQD